MKGERVNEKNSDEEEYRAESTKEVRATGRWKKEDIDHEDELDQRANAHTSAWY